jgi:hypothetical protein
MKKKLETRSTRDANLSAAIEAAMENERTPVHIDSLEACIGYGSFLKGTSEGLHDSGGLFSLPRWWLQQSG